MSPTGTVGWASCRSNGPLIGTVACSLATANNNAAAGDTVNLRGGTYTYSTNYAVAINPTKSGAAGLPITYKAYNGEEPIMLSASPSQDRTCININNRSYIRIDGVTCRNFFRWAQLQNYAHHNEISNSKFSDDTGDTGAINNLIIGLVIAGLCQGSGGYNCYSTHNWIHHNTWERAHGYTSTACLEGADMLRIGYPYGTGNDGGLNNNNTIENNTARYAGHAVLDQYGLYNVIKNNTFTNPPWWRATAACTNPPDYTDDSYDNKYSHRVMQVTRNYPDPDTYVLVEGNRLGFAGVNPANSGSENFDIAAASVITRYNDVYAGMGAGFMFKYSYSLRDKVYNNTVHHNGYGYPYWWTCTLSTCPYGGYAVMAYDTTQRTGSIVVNNILYDSSRYGTEKNDTGLQSGKAKPNNGQYFSEGPNHYTGNGDPKFANPDLSDTTSTTLPDLTLQAGSPAIDAGTHLTVAVGSGSNSTALVANDARFFQDGTWGSDLARGVTMFPDWIAISDVSNVVQIQAIDYATNTITLASAKSWDAGAKIWLFRKSDGKTVLVGSAPDFGAHEFVPTAQPQTGRIYDVPLTRDANGNYPLPVGAAKVAAYRDGLRVQDYRIEDGVLIPLAAWPATAAVFIDYDASPTTSAASHQQKRKH